MMGFRTTCLKARVLLCCLFAAAFCLAPAAAGAARPEDVFAVENEDWALKSGGVPEGACGGFPEQGLYWYGVTPGTDKAAEGLTPGILLYDAEAKKYSFLPGDEEEIVRIDNVCFSPDRKTMVVSFSMNRFSSMLTVYDIGTLAPQASFLGFGDVFFVDGRRFAFTLVEDGIERPEQAGLWGSSAALFAPDTDDSRVILKEASAKEDFTVMGVDAEGGKIFINVESVESEEDWEDVDKWHETEITADVPPAE